MEAMRISEGAPQCPNCGRAQPSGKHWYCSNMGGNSSGGKEGGCKEEFDTFKGQATCPNCGKRFLLTQCVYCGRSYSLAEFYR